MGFQSSKSIRFARTPTRAPCPTHAIIRQINATLLIIRIPNDASQILLIMSPRVTVSSGDPRYRPVADLRNNVLLYHYCGAGSVTEGCRGRTPLAEALNVMCGRVLLGRKQLGLRSHGLRSRQSQVIRLSGSRGSQYVGHFSKDYIHPYKFK